MRFDIRRYKLENGVRVMEIPMETESVLVMVMVRTGSRNEPDEKLGISHALEHMVFKGTEKYPTAKDLAEAVDSMGAVFNAYTDKDTTAFYIKSAGEYLEKSVEILGEMMTKPKLREEDWSREKGVIIEEINMYEDHPMERVAEEFENLIFAGSNMGRLIIGSKETVGGLKAEDLREYMGKWYRGENVLVIIAGRVPTSSGSPHSARSGRDDKSAFESVADLSKFGELARGEMKKFVDETGYGKERELVIEKGTEQTHFVVGVPGLNMFDERRWAEAVLRTVLGGNMSSRLFTEVREKRGLAYYVAAIGEHRWDAGYLGAKAGVRKDKFNEALAVIKEQMLIIGESIREEEIERAKKYLIGKTVLGLEETMGVARWFGGRAVIADEYEEPAEVMKKIKAVELEEVRQVAKELLREEEMRVAVVR